METPRISVNKLAEYVHSVSSTRRKQIIKDAKFPPTFKAARYSDAREFLKNYIISNYDEGVLKGGIAVIRKKPNTSDYQENDNKNSIYALELIESIELPDLEGFTIEQYSSSKAGPYLIEGIEVSVFPDLILTGEVKGKPVVGGIKLHVSKSFALLEEGQKTVATILKDFIEKNIASGRECVNACCYSIDVFAQRCEPAPTAFKQRMSQVKGACEEIASRWSSIKEDS